MGRIFQNMLVRCGLAAVACGVVALPESVFSQDKQDKWQRPRVATIPFDERISAHIEEPATPLFSEGEPRFTDGLQQQKEQRFDSLRRQIEELSRLLQGASAPNDPAFAPPIPHVPQPPDNKVIPLGPPLNLTPEGPDQQPEQHAPSRGPDVQPHAVPLPHDQVPAEAHGHSPGPASNHNQHPPLHQAAQHPPAGQQPRETPIVVPGEVDRLALATSLFGAKDWDGCLHIITETDLTSRSQEDQLWAEYLQACCLCKLDRLDQAQGMFRRILAEQDAGWIGELSKWWLEHLNERTRLKSDIQRLQQTMHNWEQVVDSLTAKP